MITLEKALEQQREVIPRVMNRLMEQGRDGLLLADELHRSYNVFREALSAHRARVEGDREANAVVERLAFEAMQWTKDPENNPGCDQPSLVFARRFAFLFERRALVQQDHAPSVGGDG